MSTTDARGHTVPADADAPTWHATFQALGLTINDPIPVANTTARTTALSTLSAAGITPSTSLPIYFSRADAAAGDWLEVTTDGTTFYTIPARQAWQNATPSSGWTNVGGRPLQYRTVGSMTELRGSASYAASFAKEGVLAIIGTVPADVSTTASGNYPRLATIATNGSDSVLCGINVRPDGLMRIYPAAALTGSGGSPIYVTLDGLAYRSA